VLHTLFISLFYTYTLYCT